MQVKIVPKNNPNSKGKWVTLTISSGELQGYVSIKRKIAYLNKLIPDTHFVCDYNTSLEQYEGTQIMKMLFVVVDSEYSPVAIYDTEKAAENFIEGNNEYQYQKLPLNTPSEEEGEIYTGLLDNNYCLKSIVICEGYFNLGAIVVGNSWHINVVAKSFSEAETKILTEANRLIEESK